MVSERFKNILQELTVQEAMLREEPLKAEQRSM